MTGRPAHSTPSRQIDALERARPELEAIPPEALAETWRAAVDRFLAARPGEDSLRDRLAESSGLSRPGLDAALEVVLRGVRSPAAQQIFDEARAMRAGEGPALVILASNLPGLVVQSLLPALALRRPLLIKSASAEPLFAPAFLDALAERLPVLGSAYAATTWSGGRREVEDPLFARAGRVVAYGDGDTVADLERRVGSKLVAFGPKISVALVASAGDPESVADGLARDIALFDQRGCLSVQSVITDGDARLLGDALARALAHLAERWPMGRGGANALAGAARQDRDEATMRGAWLADLPMAAGTVVVEPPGPLRPSPGRRFVRIHHVAQLDDALDLLEPWRGRIQGVAAAGAERLAGPLSELGVSRIAPPGALQDADIATWRNGGLAPLEAYL